MKSRLGSKQKEEEKKTNNEDGRISQMINQFEQENEDLITKQEKMQKTEENFPP